MPRGEGAVNFTKYLRALREIGFDGNWALPWAWRKPRMPPCRAAKGGAFYRCCGPGMHALLWSPGPEGTMSMTRGSAVFTAARIGSLELKNRVMRAW